MSSSAELPAAPPRPSILRKIKVQFDVIGAIILRELHTRYGRENIGYLWLILEPMLLATAVGILHSRAANHYSGDIKPVPMAVVGYCTFMILRGIINRSDGALEANLPLLYHKNVTIPDILIGRALLEVAGAFTSMVILMSLIIFLGIAELPARPLYILLGVALMFAICIGLSFIICSFSYDNRSAGRLVHPITYIMLPMSCVFYPVDVLPQWVRNIVLYIPFTHMMEMVRYGQFRTAKNIYIDYQYVGAWILTTWIFGLILIHRVKNKIILS